MKTLRNAKFLKLEHFPTDQTFFNFLMEIKEYITEIF